MNEIRTKYNVEEGFNTISIQPYNYYKTGAIWEGLGLLLSVVASIYFGMQKNQVGTVISSTIAVVLLIGLLKELLLKIPLKYTFDANQNAIFRSNLIMKNRKIMPLDKMVIFVSDSNDGWAYTIGEKKMHLVKNYKISEFFGNYKKSEKKAELYETEILNKIKNLFDQVNQP